MCCIFEPNYARERMSAQNGVLVFPSQYMYCDRGRLE